MSSVLQWENKRQRMEVHDGHLVAKSQNSYETNHLLKSPFPKKIPYSCINDFYVKTNNMICPNAWFF